MDADTKQRVVMEGARDTATSDLAGATVLVIDDEPANTRLIEAILRRAGFHHIYLCNHSGSALGLFEIVRPDLVLLDLHMPPPDGFALLGQIGQRSSEEGTFLPVVVLTGDIDRDVRIHALDGGAADFLTKPFEPYEIVLRTRNLLRTRFLTQALRSQANELEDRVRVRTREVERARFDLLERLAAAGECRDDDTGQHTRRVAELAAWLARRLGQPGLEVDALRRAAPVHDLGKIAIPDAVLLKPGPLSVEEYEIMKSHTVRGAQLLQGSPWPLLDLARSIARAHHERWDGRGYPDGLAGEAIPLPARIVAVADAYDAMTHDRPYRRALSRATALERLARDAGTQFDPVIVDLILRD
ncbi:MAG: HD domain-containing phosphohydrolase [Longimicrobiales bacterium]